MNGVIPFVNAARGLVFVSLLGACRAHLGPVTAPPFQESERCAQGVDVAALVERVASSVVSVVAGRANPHRALFGEHGGTAREHALGSGILLTADGVVLTSRHVVTGADDVRVELFDGRSYRGAVVARDAWLDVALIRLRGARDLPAATLGSSEAAKVGDPVVAMGNPFGIGPSVTRGILSAKSRSVDDGPAEVYLQTDAAVNPGDSGGPLLDAAGRVIGVNAAVLERGQGVSFAVPIDDVRDVLPELLATGRIARGHAGISYQAIDAAVARALALPAQTGAIITELDAAGPAQRAGLVAGDVILGVDGRAIARAGDLAHALGRRRAGEVVRFALLRGGRSLTLGVLLDRLPADDDDERASPPRATRVKPAMGMRFVDADGGGARIDTLDGESTLADDLRAGDVVVEVNRRGVTSAGDLDRALAAAPRPSTALLRVRRDKSFLYVGIDLE